MNRKRDAMTDRVMERVISRGMGGDKSEAAEGRVDRQME
jgi:hypothetical protein